MKCDRCRIREATVKIRGADGQTVSQQLCEECACEASSDYAELRRKLALTEHGELPCENCHVRVAEHLYYLGGALGGFWCTQCIKAAKPPAAILEALKAEAEKAGLEEGEMLDGSKGVLRRLLADVEKPPDADGSPK